MNSFKCSRIGYINNFFMQTLDLNDDLMQFFFEDMENSDSVLLNSYSAHILNEYVSNANDKQKEAMREAIMKKDIKGVIQLLKSSKE